MKLLAKLPWLAHRLSAMSAEEIVARLGTACKVRTEVSAFSQLRIPPSMPAQAVPKLPAREQAPASLKEALRAELASLQSGHWTIFRDRLVDVGSPVCWLTEPLAGVDLSTSARAHGLDHRALPNGADVRVLWEINRWSEIVRVAQAGWLGLDPESSQWCLTQLESWRTANPVGVGWNWTSPMEPALRLIALCWIDAFVGENGTSGALPTTLAHEHAFWVWRYRSVGSSANNHLIGELASLVCAQARWPQLEEVFDPVSAISQLEREILLQFAPDGGNREQALHYHLFALELCLQAAFFLREAGRPLRTEVIQRLADAADYFAEACPASGDWDYGDGDDAHVVPLFERNLTHVAEWRAWCRGEAGTLPGYWLGERTTLLGPAQTEFRDWKIFPESGLAIRNEPDWFLRLDASPLGYLSTRAHGHLDALHLAAWVRGEALLIDPGTGAYFSDASLRASLAGAAAHNGPALPDQAYPQRRGTFLWSGQHLRPELTANGNEATACWNQAGHRVRRVVRWSDDSLLITDEASTDSSVRWIFAPGWTVQAGEDSGYVLEKDGLRVQLRVAGMTSAPQIEDVICSPTFRRTQKTLSILLPTAPKAPLQSAFSILP